MRLLSGCFSLIFILVVACICVSSIATAPHNGPFPPYQPAHAYSPRPGYYVTPFRGLVGDFFRGIMVITGWTFGIVLVVCVGIPAAFIVLMLALFFFWQHQAERRHREMMEAQFARNRVIDYHSPQNPPS